MATKTNLVEPGRWLRNTKDGTIYGYCDLLAANPLTEEVSEEVAFPERHIPAGQKGRKSVVTLTEEDIAAEDKPEAKPKTRARVALEADASKGLDKK